MCSVKGCYFDGPMSIVMWSVNEDKFVELGVCHKHFNLEPTRTDFQRVPS